MLIPSNNLAHLKIKILLMQNDDVTHLLLSVETTNLSVFRVYIRHVCLCINMHTSLKPCPAFVSIFKAVQKFTKLMPFV